MAALFATTVLAMPPAHAQANPGAPLRFTTIAGGPTHLGLVFPGDTQFTGGIALDPAGNIYAIDSTTGALRKLSRGGAAVAFEAFFPGPDGGRVPAVFDGYYNGVALDSDGNIYVASGKTVCKVAPDGLTKVLADNLYSAHAIALDASGNIYVANSWDHTILKITQGGAVSVFAGSPGQPGNSDGNGSSARLYYPFGVAVDSSGAVFVADYDNDAVRKITPDRVVSTVARIDSPYGIAVDASGAVYVTKGEALSSAGYPIRKIAPDGAVTTLPGSGGYGGLIEAGILTAIAIDGHGTFHVVDGWYGAILVNATPPVLTTALMGQSVSAGGTATFRADTSGNAATGYQWLKDGVAIPGAASATLQIEDVKATDLGSYAVRLTNAAGSIVSDTAVLCFPNSNAEGLVNLSARAGAGTGSQTLIMGFVVGGAEATGTRPLLIRGVGPELESFDVPGAHADPMVTLFSGSTVVATNDNWGGEQQVSVIGAQVGAFAFKSAASRDAALYRPDLAAGAYTVHVTGVGSGTGVALAEVYDATPEGVPPGSTPRLINLSARAQVGTGPDVLIAGFRIGGTAPRTLLIRAIGPTLGSFEVEGVLDDPALDLFQGTTRLHSNDNWAGDAAVASASEIAGAFALDAASRDAAMLLTLQPGNYTVHVSGVAGTTGVALFELYDMQ